jgi:hypothetical protein
MGRAHVEAWSNHEPDTARKSLAVTPTTTKPALPATNATGIDNYMNGLIKFAQAVEPSSTRVIDGVGDERNALLMVTVKAGLGPGAKVTLPGPRLYLLGENGKIKGEQDHLLHDAGLTFRGAGRPAATGRPSFGRDLQPATTASGKGARVRVPGGPPS